MRGAAALHLEGAIQGWRTQGYQGRTPFQLSSVRIGHLIGDAARLASSLKRGATHDRRSPHSKRPPRLWLLVEPMASPCHRGR